MNVLCAICQDLLEPSNDIFITPCGHVFHFPCIIQWLEKSESCPECRQKAKRDKISRIFFNFSNAEVIKEDSVSLQQKVDSLSFKVMLKEKAYNTCHEENVILKKQNSGLREEVKKVESTINEKNAVIRALKEQSQFYKNQCNDYDKIKKEKRELENTMETYDNVKMLLSASADEVDQLLQRNTDASTLATYVGIMKRELGVSLNKRKELRNTVKRLQHDLQTTRMERNSCIEDYTKHIKRLEEELVYCQSERDEFKRKLANVENESNDKQGATSTSENSTSRKRETDTECDFNEIIPKKFRKVPEKTKLLSTEDANDSDIILVSPNVKKTKENEENSPYLPTKSKSIMALKERPTQRGTFKISSKKPLLSSKKITSSKISGEKDTSITFDGFGGHSKIDTFPTTKTSPSKFKRSMSETSRNKKIKLDLSSNKQLDDYVINLT